MKNFVYVFILLLAINIFLPIFYYFVYSKSSIGQVIDKTDTSLSDKDPLISTENDYKEGKYALYNLETKELEEMDLISFLVGSAACEVPVTYEMEAIKAQMIACHSYYLYCKKNGVPSDDLNLSFDERYMQKYASKERLMEYWGISFNDNYQKFLNCANDIKDMVLKYDGEIALTPYYAVSCGKTQTSENEWGRPLEYLKCVESADDTISDDYLKVKTFTVQEMYDRFTTSFTGFTLDIEKPEEWIGDIDYNESGYVSTVNVGGVKILGKDFRKFFELPSSCFMIFYEDGQFSIATKGFGHGVGMSQFGANQLSQKGKTHQDILMYYFPGTQLTTL